MVYNDRWDRMYEEFKMSFPATESHAVRWYPSGPAEITVTLDDDYKVIYDSTYNAIRIINKEKYSTDISEELWMECFSINLVNRMNALGVSQKELADMVGVSSQTISNYINCRRSPNAYVLVKIADALKCSIARLSYFDFEFNKVP